MFWLWGYYFSSSEIDFSVFCTPILIKCLLLYLLSFSSLKGLCCKISIGSIWYQYEDLEKLECRQKVLTTPDLCAQRNQQIFRLAGSLNGPWIFWWGEVPCCPARLEDSLAGCYAQWEENFNGIKVCTRTIQFIDFCLFLGFTVEGAQRLARGSSWGVECHSRKKSPSRETQWSMILYSF